MRIVVHDFPGYAFPMQLARELARRGHEVLHLYLESLQTPRAASGVQTGTTFTSRGLRLQTPVSKYNLIQRRRGEIRYGKMAAEEIIRFDPDAVISGQTPPDAQVQLLEACRRRNIPFVFWVQDLFGVGIATSLRRRLGFLAGPVAWYYTRLEWKLMRHSAAVVLITDDFRDHLPPQLARGDQVHVIPNWASLDEIAPQPKQNPWARRHGLDERFVLLYSGTLGLKHDPSLLRDLAARFSSDPEVRVVVVSEGPGADWLRERSADSPNLILLPYQDYNELSNVLGAGDVLVSLLEAEAASYSVPSKILTYLAAGKPLLASIDSRNLAARTITAAGAGIVTPPQQRSAFLEAAVRLRASPELRHQLGKCGRQYAETAFDIQRIGDRFEQVLQFKIS